MKNEGQPFALKDVQEKTQEINRKSKSLCFYIFNSFLFLSQNGLGKVLLK